MSENNSGEPAEKYVCDEQIAATLWKWLRSRGGILIWRSVDLSDLGASMVTPYLTEQGEVAGRPHWKMGESPRHILDQGDVEVSTAREVERFHVAVQPSRNMMFGLEVTAGGSRRLRQKVSKLREETGKEAWYAFDYGSYDNAVIMIEESRVPLAEYATTHGFNDSKTSNEAGP